MFILQNWSCVEEDSLSIVVIENLYNNVVFLLRILVVMNHPNTVITIVGMKEAKMSVGVSVSISFVISDRYSTSSKLMLLNVSNGITITMHTLRSVEMLSL